MLLVKWERAAKMEWLIGAVRQLQLRDLWLWSWTNYEDILRPLGDKI